MSHGLKDLIQRDLVTAVQTRDEVRKRVLRVVMSSIHSAEARDATVERPYARDLTDDEIRQVLDIDAQRRRRVVETYEANGRGDQATIERAELAVVEGYLATPSPSP